MKRYPGISPFSAEQSSVFFGREDEIKYLVRLINLRKQVLLYSKSGVGKTSLLQAKVIPHLRDKYLVIPIWFYAFNPSSTTDTQTPIQRVSEALRSSFGQEILESFPQSILEDLTKNVEHKETIWDDFKKIQLAKGIKFLLIFDQFEELFSYPEEQIEQFKWSIKELMSPQIPDRIMQLMEDKPTIEEHEQIEDFYKDLKIKAVFVIRSGKLSLLNKLTDKIPDIQKTFYELKPLSHNQAKDAITKPALEGFTGEKSKGFETSPFEFDEKAVSKIVNSLTDYSKQNIEATQLQIVCQRIEEIVQLKQANSSNGEKVIIKVEDLPEFNDIFLKFYEDAVENTLEPHKVRKFIESQLIQNQQRISLDELFCERHLRKESLDVLVSSHLLRIERNSQNRLNYELSHDTLIQPILQAAEERKKKEDKLREELEKDEENRKIKRRMYSILIAFILSMVLGLVAFIQYKNVEQINTQNQKLIDSLKSQNVRLSLQEAAIKTKDGSLNLALNRPKTALKERQIERLARELIDATHGFSDSEIELKKDTLVDYLEEVAQAYFDLGELQYSINSLEKLNDFYQESHSFDKTDSVLSKLGWLHILNKNYSIGIEKYYKPLLKKSSIPGRTFSRLQLAYYLNNQGYKVDSIFTVNIDYFQLLDDIQTLRKFDHDDLQLKSVESKIVNSILPGLSIKDDLLEGKEVRQRLISLEQDFIEPENIVITYSVSNSGLENMMKEINRNAKSQSAPHIIIGRNGGIIQILPFNKISKWIRVDAYQQNSIVIMLENLAKLNYGPSYTFTNESITELKRKREGPYNNHIQRLRRQKDFEYPKKFWDEWLRGKIPKRYRGSVLKSLVRSEEKYYWDFYNEKVDEKDVFKIQDNEYWHEYSQIQKISIFEVCRVISRKYQIDRVLGFNEISSIPAPGPAFPLDSLQRIIINVPRSQ